MTICSQVGRLNLYLLHLTVRRGVARVWVCMPGAWLLLMPYVTVSRFLAWYSPHTAHTGTPPVALQPLLQFQSKQPPAVASELERTVVWPRVADKLLKHAADEFK